MKFLIFIIIFFLEIKLYRCRLKTKPINYRHLYIKENIKPELICYILYIIQMYTQKHVCSQLTYKVNFHSEIRNKRRVSLTREKNLGQILIFWQRHVFLCRGSSVNYSFGRGARCYSLYLDLDWELSWSHMGWDINAISPEACAEEYEKQKRTIKKYFFFLILQTNDFISLITDC